MVSSSHLSAGDKRRSAQKQKRRRVTESLRPAQNVGQDALVEGPLSGVSIVLLPFFFFFFVGNLFGIMQACENTLFLSLTPGLVIFVSATTLRDEHWAKELQYGAAKLGGNVVGTFEQGTTSW